MQPTLQLKGKKILVTRAVHQADSLCNLIEQRQGKAVRFPVLQLLPVDDFVKVKETLGQLGDFDWVFFISSNAVNFALQTKSGRIDTVRNVRFAAIGQATAKAMQQAGIAIDLIPDQGYSSEALLDMPELNQVKGYKCLIIKGQGGREMLAETLRLRGAKVVNLEVYKRVVPVCDVQPIIKMIDNKQLDVITVTSCEVLQNLVHLLSNRARPALLLIPLVVISERIRHLANKIGFKHIMVTVKPSDAEIANTVTAFINGE